MNNIDRDQLIGAIIREVAELPDRTSPEGEPGIMLVSERELLLILERLLP